jgi:hypothetical protein
MCDQLLIGSESNTAVLEADEVLAEPSLRTKTADQPTPHVHNGYGACSAYGCYCQSYTGSAYTCANCGHNYATHW